MTDRRGRHRTNMELPVEVKEAMKESDEPMWKVVDKAVRMYFGMDEGSTEHALNRRIEELEDRISALDDEIDQRTSERDEAAELRDELVEKRNRIREEKATHRERLDEILDKMLDQADKTVLAWMSDLKEAATEEYGSPSNENIERVVGDLRTRRDERNLAIPDHRFRRSPSPTSSAAKADGGSSNKLKFAESLANGADVEGDD